VTVIVNISTQQRLAGGKNLLLLGIGVWLLQKASWFKRKRDNTSLQLTRCGQEDLVTLSNCNPYLTKMWLKPLQTNLLGSGNSRSTVQTQTT